MERKLVEISIDELNEPSWSIRTFMVRENLEELIVSIKKLGILQPLLVKQKDNRYEIVVGHRRYLAARQAGLLTVPCIIVDVTGEDQLQMMGHENIFREDVNPVDQARYLKYLTDTYGYTQSQVAGMFGRTPAWSSQILSILNYPEDVKAAVEAEQIAYATGRILSEIENNTDRRYYLQEAIEHKASHVTVGAWYKQYTALKAGTPAASPVPEEVLKEIALHKDTIRCVMCHKEFKPHQTIAVYFCREDYLTFWKVRKIWEEEGYVPGEGIPPIPEGEIQER